MRDAGDDVGADSGSNGQLVEKNGAAPLAEGERPGCPAWAEPERPCRLEQGSELARLVSAARRGKRGVHWAVGWAPPSGRMSHDDVDAGRPLPGQRGRG